jgi:hypothetical protein
MSDAAETPTLEELLAELQTDKQRRFVQEYLVDLCGAAAARRAGYPKKSAAVIAHENLRKPKIHAAVVAGLAELAEQAHISKGWIIERFKRNYWAAFRSKRYQAANRALEDLGKALGMFDADLNVVIPTDARVVLHFEDNQRGPKPKGSE